ncbi:hypothetical protein R1flu_009679 [Riccia fluitans]|uniref:Uncharacterized protein n=1 Tax=Riccia fluitans TaxID=41844 RepID=A0ABD1Z6Z7_9MARC
MEPALASASKSVFFKADSYVLKKPEVQAKLKEVWVNAMASQLVCPLQFSLGCLEGDENSDQKQQYAKVEKISKLSKMRLELEWRMRNCNQNFFFWRIRFVTYKPGGIIIEDCGVGKVSSSWRCANSIFPQEIHGQKGLD